MARPELQMAAAALAARQAAAPKMPRPAQEQSLGTRPDPVLVFPILHPVSLFDGGDMGSRCGAVVKEGKVIGPVLRWGLFF